jgi:hypothetical protein
MKQSGFVWLTVITLCGAIGLFFSEIARSQVVQPAAESGSLRFFGTGTADLDRVKIRLDNAGVSRPVNVAQDLTVEFWIKGSAAANTSDPCDAGRGWYYGRVLIDRDIFGDADAYGDYGISIMGGHVIAGLSNAAGEAHLCSSISVTDNQWRHVAFTRSAATGVMRLFIDGAPAGQANGPTGRLDYQIGRATDYPASDPYLVLGAEKHDFPGSLYYNGLLDDLRISNNVRYNSAFTRPNAPHPADANTAALYRFDEGAGVQITDSSGAAGGPSNGVLNPRSGNNAAEHWSSDTPFGNTSPPPPTNTPSPTSSAAPLPTEEPVPVPTEVPSPTASPTPKPTCTGTATSTITQTAAGTVTPSPTHTPSRTPTSISTSAILPPTPASAPPFRVFLPLMRCP